MKNINPPSKSMIREFTKQYTLISLIPVFAFLLIAITEGYFTQQYTSRLFEKSASELNTDAKAELEKLGQMVIQDKARNAAQQVALFLSFNPDMDMQTLQQSDPFQEIAMQKVGKTGYVCMYESGSGIMRIHPNPNLVDRKMAFLSKELPTWWAIFSRSLLGEEVSGYYDWIEPDGTVRKKYMTMTPVNASINGRVLMVAATTYIDEFSEPVAAMEQKAGAINDNLHDFLSRSTLLSIFAICVFLLVTFLCVYHFGRKSALYYMLPIVSMADNAKKIGDGHWSAGDETDLLNRKDEIGVLAQSFESMRSQLQKLFQDLENRVVELKASKDSLKESETHFRSLFDGVPVGLYRTTFDGDIIDANPTLVKMLGYHSKEQFLSRKAEAMYAEAEDRVKWKRNIEQSNDDNVHEVKLRRFDDSEIWVENHSRLAREDDHTVIHIEGSLIDITERKQAVEALRESEARYRTLTELLPIAIFETDDKGTVTFANAAAYQMTGYDRSDFESGLNLSNVISTEDHAKALTLFEKVLSGVYADGTEYVIRRKDGSLFQGFINARPTDDAEPGLIGYIFDLTTLKQAEKALRESEEKLARSQKMESLGLLAGGVAHDLNNILSGIVSYPELILLDLPEDSRLRKPIETMQASGNKAAAIVQDLLTVARGVATTKAPLNINDLIGDYFKSPEFKKLTQFHPEVSIKSDLDKQLFSISGSSVHITKVIMNLVSNASEAIEGTGTVTITTTNRYVDEPLKGYGEVNIGEYVVLTVSDDGSGISREDQDRIFEPFYSKKVMGRSGTGLGLAVVWNTVLDHKGYIDVSSSRKATTFNLYFPITREETSGKVFNIPIEVYKGCGERVLIIDDVESQREISCRILEKLGYQTDSVGSGEEAVEFLKKKSVDLILLDMIMAPGMSGRETYESIIKIHRGQKAVIASGYAETDDVKAVQALGAGRYIKKPFTLENIGLAVKEALEIKK